jgi:hypothetical protein
MIIVTKIGNGDNRARATIDDDGRISSLKLDPFAIRADQVAFAIKSVRPSLASLACRFTFLTRGFLLWHVSLLFELGVKYHYSPQILQ